MTSPDERFDDAFLSREPPEIKQYTIYDPVLHEYRLGINMWPAACVHCHYGGAAVDIHICDLAVADWIWNLPQPDRIGPTGNVPEQMYRLQMMTEEEASGRARKSEADFWNRMFGGSS